MTQEEISTGWDQAKVATLNRVIRSIGDFSKMRHKAFITESRLPDEAWKRIHDSLNPAIEFTSDQDVIKWVVEALHGNEQQPLTNCALCGSTISTPIPTLLGRAYRQRSAVRRAQAGDPALGSSATVVASSKDIVNVLSRGLIWCTWNENDPNGLPFASVQTEIEAVCRLGIPIDIPSTQYSFVQYSTNGTIKLHFPTLGDATWRSGASCGWHEPFLPAPIGLDYGRTQAIQAFKHMNGLPEAVHKGLSILIIGDLNPEQVWLPRALIDQ